MKKTANFVRIIKVIIIAVAAGCLAYVSLPFFTSWEAIFLDWHLRDASVPKNDEKIVVILGGDNSMIEFGSWPWPRSLYSELLTDHLASARVVAFDIFLVDKSTGEQDSSLAEAMEGHGNVALGNVFRNDGVLLEPLEMFRKGAKTGYMNYYPDSDHVMREYPLAHIQDSGGYRTLTPSFVYAVLDAAGYAPFIDASNTLHTLGDDLSLALNSGQSVFKLPLGEDAYPVYEFSDVLRGRVPAEAFEDAIVLVGISATGASDNIHTSLGYAPGTRVLADVLYSVLSGYTPRTAPALLQIMYFVLAIGACLFFSARLPSRLNWLPMVITLVLLLLIPHLLFIRAGMYFASFTPALFVLLCGGMQLFHAYIVEDARKRQEMLMNMITSFVSALDAKDPITAGHSLRVSEVSAQIAARKGLGRKKVETIRLAGLIHDIGKIGVPDTVLNKPGKYTPEEFEQMKAHPGKGIKIMERAGIDPEILSGISDHHERPDGKGYPSGKKAGELSLCAEIIKIADVYDALTSKRQYKEAWPVEKACDILYRGRNTEFNAELVDLFLEEIRPAGWRPPVEQP